MKLKKAQKLETALVTVLEFVRIVAATNPKVTNEALSRMRISGEMFAPCVGMLVRIAIKNADAIGDSIDEILDTLRKKSKKRKGNLPSNFFMGTAAEFTANVNNTNAKKDDNDDEDEETEEGDYDNDAEDADD